MVLSMVTCPVKTLSYPRKLPPPLAPRECHSVTSYTFVFSSLNPTLPHNKDAKIVRFST